MGTCASVNTRPSQRITVRENTGLKPTNCPKHWDNAVTHYNERNNELYCLSCFQDYKRRNPRGEHDVIDINKYVTTLIFKQTETNLLNKLQSNRRKAEHQLLQITQNKKAIENKKLQFGEEIKAFVKTLLELIQHLGQDLCQETNSKISSALEELDRGYKEVEKQLEKTTSLSKDIENNGQSNNNAARVDTMIKCKGFFKKYSHFESKGRVKNFEPSLRLHKSLTLKDIVGNGGQSNRVSLGTVTCDERTELNHDSLSDISETSNETDDEFRMRNGVRRTPTTRTTYSGRVSGQSHSVSPTKRIGNTAMLVHGDNNEYSSPIAGTRAAKLSTNDETNSEGSTDSAYLNVGTCSVASPSQKKHVGEDGDRVSRNLSRTQSRLDSNTRQVSSNTGKLSLQQTPTPRKSSQSIVSPGNISAALFSTPRPGAYKESMERRIAEKLKVVALPRDENVHNITDTVVLDDGRIVLCDQKNEKLILMNDKQDIVHDIRVRGHPHNVAIVPGDICKVAVTIPDENIVKIIQVDVEAFSDEIEVVSLQSKPKCRGIEYVSDNMLYTTKNDVAVLRKDDQRRTWKFKYAFRQPVSLYADRNKQSVYISCYGTNSSGEVVKMKYADESIDFIISYPEIKHPVCTAVDGEGYIYVCDVDPPSIHQVTSKGEYCRRLLSASDGKFQHVNFIPGSDVFIATENDSDRVQFYCMK